MSGGVPAGELLPCPNPWCERIEGVEASQHLATERWHVCCDDCMIEGPWAKTYDEAVAAWNTRATPTPPIEGRDADVERELRVAKAIARANGDEFANAFVNKTRWIAKRGMSGGRFRDANEPFQSDYMEMARAALQALGERG